MLIMHDNEPEDAADEEEEGDADADDADDADNDHFDCLLPVRLPVVVLTSTISTISNSTMPTMSTKYSCTFCLIAHRLLHQLP